MFRIKRLYTFVLGTFLPLILATFSVCLFILLMQFLWQYVDEMVGKGIDFSILGELFFYAMLGLISMALPLAVLLASLMTFGNLGEHLELLAMKSSGISLIRIMKPLIVLVIVISGISFVFQNNIQPLAQKKWMTIMYSLKQKSPELSIPEGIYTKNIPDYNFYIDSRTKDGLMKGITIYNYSRGAANMEVIRADSGRMKSSEGGKSLFLTLYQGESFRNYGEVKSNSAQQPIPYMREKFSLKEIVIEYDSNLNLADESIYENREVSKDLKLLKLFADSVRHDVDSIATALAPNLKRHIYQNSLLQTRFPHETNETTEDTAYIHDFQLFYDHSTIDQKIRYLEGAESNMETALNEYVYQERVQTDMKKQMKSHQVEFYKKFTLSLACLFFFFIGAPLGAIIRKGGLGMPAVLSVIIFLLYYATDLFAVKLARSDVWPVWLGASTSSILLIFLGIFFTYKAVNDSVIMNPDAWKDTLQRLIGKRESRNYVKKDVIMNTPDYLADIKGMDEWDGMARDYLNRRKRFPFYFTFWRQDFRNKELDGLIERMESWIEDLRNSDENLILGKLMDYPVIQPVHWDVLNTKAAKWFCAIFLPVGLCIYFIEMYRIRQIRQDLKTGEKVNSELRSEIIKLKLSNNNDV